MKRLLFAVCLFLFLCPAQAFSQTYIFDDQDGSSFTMTGAWVVNPNKAGAYNNNHTWSHNTHPLAAPWSVGEAIWSVTSPAGKYKVLVHWHELSNRAPDARYRVTYDGLQTSDYIFDQRDVSLYERDGEDFAVLGEFCNPTKVSLSNLATQSGPSPYEGYVSADAVKLVRLGDCDPPTGGGSGVSARAYGTYDQSIPHATGVFLALDAERYDFGDLHDNVSNNTRLVAPVSGVYSISGHVHWSFVSAGTRIIGLTVNGTQGIAGQLSFGSSFNSVQQSVSTNFLLNAGDYVELSVYQSSGGTISVRSSDAISPELSMHLLHQTE